MNYVIAAHIKNLDTWKSYVLLHNSIPFYIKDDSTKLNESVDSLMICYNKFFSKGSIRFNHYNTTYYDGVIHGASIHIRLFLPDFQFQQYNQGKIEGKVISFKNDQIYSLAIYRENKLHGKYIIYHSNGVIAEEGNHENNLKHGEIIHYDEKGQISLKSIYQNGNKIYLD